MPEQVGQEADHCQRDARHLDQQTEQYEERDREQDQMAHALIHPPDNDDSRRSRGQCDISKRSQAKRKGDWKPEQHHGTNACDEEQKQVPVSERLEHGASHRHGRSNKCNDTDCKQSTFERTDAEDLEQTNEQHQPKANG